MIRAILVGVLALGMGLGLGCDKKAGKKKESTTTTKAGDAGVKGCPSNKMMMSTATRFRCASDADCVNNCTHGAINKVWHRVFGHGCKDGCAGPHAGKPLCVAGLCTAFDHKKKKVDSCNNRPAPLTTCVDIKLAPQLKKSGQ